MEYLNQIISTGTNYYIPFYAAGFLYLTIVGTLISHFWKTEQIVASDHPTEIKTKSTNPIQLTINGYIDIKDKSNVWLEGQIKKIEHNRIFVHYLGWDTKWDEWINKNDIWSRYAPLHTFSEPKKISTRNAMGGALGKKEVSERLQSLMLDKNEKSDDLNINKHIPERKLDTKVNEHEIKKGSSDIVDQPVEKHSTFNNNPSVGDKIEILRNSGEWTNAEIVDIDHSKQLYSVKWSKNNQSFSKIVTKDEFRRLSYNLSGDVTSSSQTICPPSQNLDSISPLIHSSEIINSSSTHTTQTVSPSPQICDDAPKATTTPWMSQSSLRKRTTLKSKEEKKIM